MKVLLAAAEPITRTTLEHWLAGLGYSVTTASDGEEALSLLRADPEIRIALIDSEVPKIDGASLCRKIRGGLNEPYLYVVLLCDRARRNDLGEGLDAGVDDYVVKPVSPLDLEVRLRAGRRVVELQEQVVSARESLRFEAMHDGLTGLLNRRAVLELLERELSRASRHGAPLSVALVELDDFKSINDRHGHSTGDAVLREVTRRLLISLRVDDSVGRFGGTELLCVLPECSSAEASALAAGFGELLTREPFLSSEAVSIALGVSVGVASSGEARVTTAEELTRAAGAALRRAKRSGNGGSRVCLATPEEFVQHRNDVQGLARSG